MSYVKWFKQTGLVALPRKYYFVESAQCFEVKGCFYKKSIKKILGECYCHDSTKTKLWLRKNLKRKWWLQGFQIV